MKKCPHISKAVKLQNLQNKVPHTTLGQCVVSLHVYTGNLLIVLLDNARC